MPGIAIVESRNELSAAKFRELTMDSVEKGDHGRGESQPKRPGLLKHQIQLTKWKTENGEERYTIKKIQETLSFEKGFFLFIRAIQQIAQNNTGVVLVGLAGPSGAGKTVFSDKVVAFMPDVVTISMDMYNDASRLIDGNFDDPRLTDYELLLENINALRSGQSAEVPIYDFKSSTRVGHRKVEVPASRIVIIEGIYALSERLRPLLDLRVSVTGGVHFDLVKRVLRDINRSGQEPEDIIHQISETVYPMYKAFIEPDLETAHIKIVNKFNPFSGFQNATYILKSDVTVAVDTILAALGPNCSVATEETYDIYLLPPGEDRDTCQSYLRMRNRDGRYSLMFEEWVTDGPFIISPRIVFEVSVRLLGGLMALGYEMATILKRVSCVYHDEAQRLTVKVDKLEQLQRSYVQVQGKDRKSIRQVAQKLGMEGHYMPRSYIEQIQLENLTKEVQAVPQELKERFGDIEEMAASPHMGSMAMSWAEHNAFGKALGRSQTWSEDRRPQTMSSSAPEWHTSSGRLSSGRLDREHENEERRQENDKVQQDLGENEDEGNYDVEFEKDGQLSRDRGSLSREQLISTSAVFSDQSQQVVEQLQGVTQRLDELLSRVADLEARLTVPNIPQPQRNVGTAAARPSPASGLTTGGKSMPLANGHPAAATSAAPQQYSISGSWGSQSSLLNGAGAASQGQLGSGRRSGSNSPGAEEHRTDEIQQLLRHITTQLGILMNEKLHTSSRELSNPSHQRNWWSHLTGSMRTDQSGLAATLACGVACVAVIGSTVVIRNRSQ